ncbi:hypothetical protein OIE62_40230 [Streptomyces scopuliridis]|uniref:Uncharacterized protein n=1 Tax=Streptomyces scopuliridis TaxID=452529 RepID=A0ACD4ZC27_9ACTN|nr:hypothetical protein [Streptomyces scopuliridis]WSB95698.1 hypothetical protein OG835_00690 [Streptomyces scopuliridis]WSC10594.1 hypothetical protein OIE62_40230 [Streptomyces scopuliridis]
MTDKPETERVDCTDRFALPGPDNTRVAYVKTNGRIRPLIARSRPWPFPDFEDAITACLAPDPADRSIAKELITAW